MCRVVPTLASWFAPGRFVGPLVAILVVVLGCCRAEASCGDWLDGHGRIADARTSVAKGPTATARPEATGIPRPDAPAVPACDGPACRGVPFVPAMPREATADAPAADPADHVVDAVMAAGHLSARSAAAGDPHPLSVVVPVPIRPPRRALLQA